VERFAGHPQNPGPALLVPCPGVFAPHLWRAPCRSGGSRRATDVSTRRRTPGERSGARWPTRCPPRRYAWASDEPFDAVAARARSARSGPPHTARAGRRCVCLAARPAVRDDPGGSRAASPGRSAPRRDGAGLRELAAGACGRGGHPPRPGRSLHRWRPPSGAQSDSGGGSVPSSEERRRDGGAGCAPPRRDGPSSAASPLRAPGARESAARSTGIPRTGPSGAGRAVCGQPSAEGARREQRRHGARRGIAAAHD
jgi:hypothetical protein